MSNFFSAVLFYLIIRPISLLPFPILYGVSDFSFLILYYIFPYRKKIVMENLRGSFPEKSEAELNRICKAFYKHFCDLTVETIKLFTASRDSIQKRVKLINVELLESFYKQNKSLILATGHYANWEWPAITLPSHSHHFALGIYQPLSNKFFDNKLITTRSRFGMTLMPVKQVAKYFEDHYNQTCAYGFINDQSPSNPDRAYWGKFLNRDTAMLAGTERYARQYNFPVIYGEIKKISRGHYSIEYKLVSEFPKNEPEGVITQKCATINESIIRSQPEYWLWTHRRWKHKR